MIENWWRRRESNPRPETFSNGIYMLILFFMFSPSVLPAGRIAAGTVC